MTGADMRAMRERLHLSQEALARILGVAMATVYRWEARPDTKIRRSGSAGLFLEALIRASHRDRELVRHMSIWRDRGLIYFWARIFTLAHEELEKGSG